MKDLNLIINKIKNNEKILLIFDYDGTLTPIQEKPELAIINQEVFSAIKKISKNNNIKIAVVTGRSLVDLKILSGFDSSVMLLSGMHGGEIELEGKAQESICDDKTLKILKEFSDTLKVESKNLDGIIIEDKKFSVALHYRLASNEVETQAIKLFNTLTSSILKTGVFKIQTGKKVIELLPYEFSKDKAVLKIIDLNHDFSPIYFGDDITDIVAFKEVKLHNGIAVGIKPLPFDDKSIVDFEVSQKELEEFLINLTMNSSNS